MDSKIAIISPDPQTLRLIALRLEIDGMEVACYTSSEDFVKKGVSGFGLALLDIVNFEPKSISELDVFAKHSKRNRTYKTVVILPRGSTTLPSKKSEWTPTIEIKRPFEIGCFSEIMCRAGVD
jgi:DNA-binding NtrC family response regulator